MPRHAEFDVPQVDPTTPGPTFTLRGETFHCLPVMPAGAFMALPDNVTGQVIESGPFILACLVEEDEERFRAVLASKRNLIQAVDLMPTLRWLVQEAWSLEDEPPTEAAAPTP